MAHVRNAQVGSRKDVEGHQVTSIKPAVRAGSALMLRRDTSRNVGQVPPPNGGCIELDGDEAHGRPLSGLRGGLGVGLTGLAAFDGGLHVGCRYQLDRLAERMSSIMLEEVERSQAKLPPDIRLVTD